MDVCGGPARRVARSDHVLYAHGAPSLALAPAAQQAVHRLDAALPVFDLKTVDAQIGETHFLDRLLAWLAVAFGSLATLLASIGLYGITAFNVTRRTQEIGIRMALGAARGNVLRLVMREVLILSAAGLLVGVPATLALGRVLESAFSDEGRRSRGNRRRYRRGAIGVGTGGLHSGTPRRAHRPYAGAALGVRHPGGPLPLRLSNRAALCLCVTSRQLAAIAVIAILVPHLGRRAASCQTVERYPARRPAPAHRRRDREFGVRLSSRNRHHR